MADLFSERFIVINDRSADHIAVPVQVLRSGMDDQVRAELEGSLKIRGKERIIHHGEEFFLFGEADHGFEVKEDLPKAAKRKQAAKEDEE